MARKEKTTRRGNGEGSIKERRKLDNGETVWGWAIRAVLPTGEPRRLKGTHQGRSIAEARKAMHDAKRECEAGQRVVDVGLTVGALLDEWMTRERRNAGLSPRTVQIQEDLIRLHVRPLMGDWRVASLTPALIESFHAALMAKSGLERGREQIKVLLNQAMTYAVRRGYLPTNPTQSVALPRRYERRKQAAQKVMALTAAQAGQLERAALERGDMLDLALVFTLRTGLRRGEVLGLRWSDVNLEDRTLRVEQVLAAYGQGSRTLTEPKNDASRRTIPISQTVVDVLIRVQDIQVSRMVEGQSAPEYVFTTRQGGMQHPRNLNRRLKVLTASLDLPPVTVHGLRHTMVSVAANQGVPIKRVSAYIGHKTTLVTQAVYWHHFPEEQQPIELKLDGP